MISEGFNTVHIMQISYAQLRFNAAETCGNVKSRMTVGAAHICKVSQVSTSATKKMYI